MLGTRTLRSADRKVGDTVRATISGRPRTLRVVGRAVFPALGAGSFSPTNLGEGAAMTVDGLDVASGDDGRYSVLLIRVKPGADLAAAHEQLSKVLRPMEFCGGDTDCVQQATGRGTSATTRGSGGPASSSRPTSR